MTTKKPDWRTQLNGLQRTRTTRAEQEAAEFIAFMAAVVRPAFAKIAKALTERGRTVTPRETAAVCGISVANGAVEEIAFKVFRHPMPNTVLAYIEVKMRERKGLRIKRTEGPLKDPAPDSALENVTPDDIEKAFYKHYNEALGNL